MPSSSSGSRSKRRGGGGGGRGAAAAAAGVGTSKGGGKFEGEGRIGQNHNDDELEEEQEQQQQDQKASTRSSGTLPTLHGISSSHSSAYTIASIDSMEGGGSAILWMSEAAMVSASLSASQPVAISVMVMGIGEIAGSYQLESLERLCSRHFNITVFQCLMDVPGVFCAIAAAWPCRKLVKNEVRLSKELANTLGRPSVRMNVLVSPLNVDITSFEAKIYRASASSNKTSAGVTLQECSRLCLRWCPPESAAKLYHEILPPEAADNKWKSPEVSTDFWSPTSIAKDCVSQPGTPKTPHKFLDCSNRQMGSLLSPAFSDSKKIKLQPPCQSFTRDVNHMQMNNSLSALLEAGSNKSRELLEFFASRWLFGRVLLKGNFVTIPILGYSCVFNVIEAQSSLQAPNLADQDDTSGCTEAISCSRKEDSIPPEIFETFIVGSKTSISLLPPTVTVESTPGSFIENTDVSGTCNRQKPSKELGECMIPTLEKFKYSALGGLSEQIATLKEIIELSILRPELLTRLGLQPAKGVLLHGPPGTGKTSLAVASACEAGLKIFSINGPEIISEFYGESEAALQTVFASAQEAAPSVVFIDELDAIAPQRKEGSEELAQRMVAALLTLMDGGDQNLHRVLVIAATNRLEAIDPALRRPGRFDREIEIGVPPPAGRCEILQKSLHQMSHTLGTSDVEALAAATHGFVGADLMALCNEAAMAALRRYVKLRDSCWRSLMKSDGSLLSLPFQEDIASQTHQVIEGMQGLHLSNDLCLATISRQGENDTVAESWLRVTHEDFEEAKSKVRPSAMREVMLEVPKVRWSDIGGQMEVKQQLQEAVEWPQKHGDALTRIGAIPPRGVLMYGPPGCSKTLMARAVATEAGLNFIAVKGPELFSKWVGESEKAVHALFERARAAAPSVVFFDEIDGLAVTRDSGHDGVSVGDRVMSQLLIEMDGINSRAGVTVIAATNRPDKIDPALLRPGRFDRLLYVGPPDEAARHEIFRIHMRKMPCASDVVESILAARTHGYSGADIAAVCRAAAMAALEEDLDASQVMMHHFEFALGAVQPSCKTLTEFSYPQFHWGLKTH